jgi:hypothetical protein
MIAGDPGGLGETRPHVDAYGRLSIRVKLNGFGLYRENLSRRDRVKVAQYPPRRILGYFVESLRD